MVPTRAKDRRGSLGARLGRMDGSKRIHSGIQLLPAPKSVPDVVYGAINHKKLRKDAKDITKKNDDEHEVTDDHETSYLELVKKNRPFRLYLFSYIANHMGEWLTYLATISAIEEIQRERGRETTSRVAISILIIIRLLPNVVLAPFGGVMADGLDRRKAMIYLDCLGAAVALLFIVAFNTQNIALIYLATFLQECVAGLYEPSRKAIIPLLVPEEEEMKMATTLAELAWSVMAAVGSAAGGVLVLLLGVRSCYLIDSCTYLLSAYLMSLMGGKWCVAPTEPVESVHGYVRGMVVDGINYLRNSFFGGLVLMKFSAAMIYGATDVLNVSFSERGDVSNRSARLGLLFASVGTGCLCGPLIADRYTDMSNPKTLQLVCVVAMLVIGLGTFMLGFADHFGQVLWLTGLRSMGQSVAWIYSSLLLQKFSNPEMFGRVSATDYSLASFAEGLSALIAGLMQDNLQLSAEDVSLYLGSLGLLLGMLWLCYHRAGRGACHYAVDAPSTGTTSSSSTESPAQSETMCLVLHGDEQENV